jgi:hypothetical protein
MKAWEEDIAPLSFRALLSSVLLLHVMDPQVGKAVVMSWNLGISEGFCQESERAVLSPRVLE